MNLYHEDKIDSLICHIKDQISRILDNLKKEFFDVVKKKTEQILCSDCIQTCIFKNRLWEEFEKKIETNDYIDINNFFIDMH